MISTHGLKWKTSYTTESGDAVVLRYFDEYTPASHTNPPEYDIEYISLTVNGERVDKIEDYLETLTDWEKEQLFLRAEDDEDYDNWFQTAV